MSSSNLVLRVVEITPETADAITIHLEHPAKEPIPYQAGQFLTLLVPVNGKQERRAYSLCSAPAEQPRLAVTVKRVAGGLISNYLLNQLRVGDTLEVLPPMGNFCLYPAPATRRPVVLIGAGSGITPLLSIAKAVLREETSSRVVMIYGNRNEETVIFKDQLQQLQTQYPERLRVDYIYSRSANGTPAGTGPKAAGSFLSKFFGRKQENALPSASAVGSPAGYTGRLNRSLLLQILEKHHVSDYPDTQYFICGPAGLMDEAKAALQILRVPPDQIFRESFVSTGHNAADTGSAATATASEGVIRDQMITIQHDGQEHRVAVTKDKTILEAALAQGIDLPYSCQAGLCTACRGKCLSGQVHLDEREGLSDAEMAEGYVLTCVGHPLTDDVVIQIG